MNTHIDVNYDIIYEDAKLYAIKVKRDRGEQTYYFNPNKGQMKVTNELLECALRALLKTNPGNFDIMTVSFYGLKEQEEYMAIATKVFKDYWNELYNLTFADVIFGRRTTFDSIGETYDFFAENKE